MSQGATILYIFLDFNKPEKRPAIGPQLLKASGITLNPK